MNGTTLNKYFAVLFAAWCVASGCATLRYRVEYSAANGAGRPDGEVAIFRSSDAWRVVYLADRTVQFQQGPKPHDRIVRLLPGEYEVAIGMFEPIVFSVRLESSHVYEVRSDNHVIWARLGHRTDYWIHDVTTDRAISEVRSDTE